MPFGLVSHLRCQEARSLPGALPFDAGQVASVIQIGLRPCLAFCMTLRTRRSPRITLHG